MKIFEDISKLINVGGSNHVLLLPVGGHKLIETFGVNDESIVAYNVDHWDVTYDDEQIEWSTDSWSKLIEYVGFDLANQIHSAVQPYRTKVADLLKDEDKLLAIKKLVELTNAASQLYDFWNDNLNVGYPFKHDYERLLVNIVNWQQAVIVEAQTDDADRIYLKKHFNIDLD